MRLGDIDAVFEDVTTVHGKKQRLQALGYYYETFTAGTASNVTEAFTNCLASWKSRREAALGHALATDADVEAELRAQVRLFILEDGALPAAGVDKKIRFPGAFT